MEPESVTVRYGESTLCAVPSIHFNHYFAVMVNRLCHAAAARPEAIAVELGPRAVSASTAWLRELRVAHAHLPVMLGLLKKRRNVRRPLPGKEQELLLLSPTDSIIEALRCGIECDLPIYGVDLDDHAEPTHSNVAIQMPEAGTSLSAFVDGNSGFAASDLDEKSDPVREAAMAAHLKALLKRYRRVLFVCGLGHWQRLIGLLRDDAIAPSMPAAAPVKMGKKFRRVVVDPSIAVAFMDLFPTLAQSYEMVREDGSRQGPCLPFGNSWSMAADPAEILRSGLGRTYRKRFDRLFGWRQDDDRGWDIENIGAFEGYLANLCLLNQRPLPDLSSLVKAAGETMSGAFAAELLETFMDSPWVSPEDFPDCSFLGPGPDGEREHKTLLLTNPGDRTGELLQVRLMNSPDVRPGPVVAFRRSGQGESNSPSSERHLSCTWGPWDRLLSSLSLKAARHGQKWRSTRSSVDFEGSLLDGLDIKRTMRAFSRHEERYSVRDVARDISEPPDFTECFPVVWLFTHEDPSDADWHTFIAPYEFMENHARNVARFKRSPAGERSSMVALISYGTEQNHPGVTPGGEFRAQNMAGAALFLPICFNNKQQMRWAETTGYRSNPYCSDPWIDEAVSSDLGEYYDKVHDVRLGRYHWSTSLIHLALPFCKDTLTVVVPEGLRLERAVYERARKLGKTVQPVPLAAFPRASVDRLTRCHLVTAIAHDPICIYPAQAEDFTGEKQTDNIGPFPRCLRDFGKVRGP